MLNWSPGILRQITVGQWTVKKAIMFLPAIRPRRCLLKCSVVLCRSWTCCSNKQICWVNEVDGITSWTDSFLSQFSWAQPRACRPGVGLPWLTQRTVRTWFTFMLWFVHDSWTYCTQNCCWGRDWGRDSRSRTVLKVLCNSLTHSGQRSWFTFSNVLQKLALCC